MGRTAKVKVLPAIHMPEGAENSDADTVRMGGYHGHGRVHVYTTGGCIV